MDRGGCHSVREREREVKGKKGKAVLLLTQRVPGILGSQIS
jgi:hypothetical protein